MDLFGGAHGLAFSAGPRPVLWASADTPAGRLANWRSAAPQRRSKAFPRGTDGTGADPPAEVGMGVPMSTFPDADLGIPNGGSLP